MTERITITNTDLIPDITRHDQFSQQDVAQFTQGVKYALTQISRRPKEELEAEDNALVDAAVYNGAQVLVSLLDEFPDAEKSTADSPSRAVLEKALVGIAHARGEKPTAYPSLQEAMRSVINRSPTMAELGGGLRAQSEDAALATMGLIEEVVAVDGRGMSVDGDRSRNLTPIKTAYDLVVSRV